MSKDKKKKKKLPLYVRAPFWGLIVIGCAVAGVLAGNFLSPVWNSLVDRLGSLPRIGSHITAYDPGTPLLAAVVGIVLSQFLGSLMRGMRRL